ncbi:hypothetical protein RND81_10G229200 [Saponaria officinalis]|uniref:Transcription factor MYB98 n=1 Tax=Saponaria officinalis TaxID=3572 RepID=A0AAW1I5J1_SAPOF
MDFDAKYMEKHTSQQIPFFLQENYSSKQIRDDHQFSLEGAFSSKVTNNNFIQDNINLHPLENFNLNVPSSSSSNHPIFSLQPTSFYQFDNSGSNCLPNFDFYETKPYGTHAPNTGALGPMDNLCLNGPIGGLGHSELMVTPINLVSPSAYHGHHPFSYRDFSLLKSCQPSDVGSCSSPKIDLNLVKKGCRGRKKKINVVKGQWTIEEDRLLIQLVERYGIRKWSQIAQMLNGRIGKQCRERWHNHLRPDIKKDVWSEEEDRILIKAHAEIGNKWAEIAKKLPGRTENSIKNHWNATKRRQLSTRKCRSKYPRQSSLLQDYIKTLTPETINAGCRKRKPSNNISTKNINININNNPNPNIENNNNNNDNNTNNKSANDQLGTSESCSSYPLEPEFDFSDVPDFNFDAQMFEESSIDSLLDCVPNEEVDNVTPYYDDDNVDVDDDEDEQFHGKKELDLVEMINQVNL